MEAAAANAWAFLFGWLHLFHTAREARGSSPADLGRRKKRHSVVGDRHTLHTPTPVGGSASFKPCAVRSFVGEEGAYRREKGGK